MTEEHARKICAELGATFSLRKRRKNSKAFIYVCRWLPKAATIAAGYKNSKIGQQFERYVCPLDKITELDESMLRSKIACLPINPNKLPKDDSQQIERTTPALARWHVEAGTAPELAAPELAAPASPKRRKKQEKA